MVGDVGRWWRGVGQGGRVREREDLGEGRAEGESCCERC